MLLYKSKSFIKKVFRRFGYNLVKLPSQKTDKSLPYVRRYRVGGIDFDFWIADETGRTWYEVEGIENTAEARALLELTQPGDNVLEVGCHHGFYTMLLARAVGPAGRVLALEAEAQNALIASAQVVLNNLGSNVTILHRAGADRPGSLNMTTSDGSNAYMVTDDKTTGMSVEAVTGDNLADAHGPFDLLKIDVEGFEAKVLAGCKKILAARPKLALELHLALMGNYGAGIEDIFKLINVDDYQGRMIVPPNFNKLVEFNPQKIPPVPGINIFLRPRQE